MHKYHTFAYSVQGNNHKKKNVICEDSSDCVWINESTSAIIVADGHGSSDYPRTALGSKYAVKAVKEALKDFFELIDQDKENNSFENKVDLQMLAKNVLFRWHEYVEYDLKEHPLNQNELESVSEKYVKLYADHDNLSKAYGTTLLVACITECFWFSFQIGDGTCLAIDEKNQAYVPIEEDEECNFNITTSLCDSDAIEKFRYHYDTKTPKAIFLGTDGIENSYSSEDELKKLYFAILDLFDKYDTNICDDEVRQFLSVITEKGSGDDVSIAGIIREGMEKK